MASPAYRGYVKIQLYPRVLFQERLAMHIAFLPDDSIPYHLL